jgi:hypothetical protein
MGRYLVELYLSRSGAGELRGAAARARAAAAHASRGAAAVRYLRSVFVPEDETWFLLYEAQSAGAVERAVALADLPRGRIVSALTQP